MANESSMTTIENPKILAVDDTPDNLFLLEAILSEESYQFSGAESAKSALETVQKLPPDLILLDVMMPEMNGYEVTRQIRQNPKTAHIPILLLTAHDRSVLNKGMKAGANGLLCKPFDIPDLLNQIAELLACDCDGDGHCCSQDS